MATDESRTRLAIQVWKASGGNTLSLLWRTVADAIATPFYRFYERWLNVQALEFRVPQHIGIIMDGNRRFARLLGASDLSLGHKLGADKLREMLDWCFEHRIPVVTVWGFSL